MSCPALQFSPWSLSDYPVYALPCTMETPKWKPSLVFYLHAQIYRNPPPPTTTATTTTMKPYSPTVIKLHPSHSLYIEGSGNGNGTIRPCRANYSMNKQLVFGPPNGVRFHVCMCVCNKTPVWEGRYPSEQWNVHESGRQSRGSHRRLGERILADGGTEGLASGTQPPPPTWYHLYRAIRAICIFYVLYFGRLRWMNCSPSSDLAVACEEKRTQFIALDLWGFLLDRFAHRTLRFQGLLGLSPG